MSELDELWRQLREAPHDAALHPVLADALIEAGDPLGELMSVQLDIEVSRGHELIALRARERELLATLRRRLLGGLPRGDYKVKRGLVAGARFGAGFTQDPAILAERTFLDEVTLRVNFDPIVVRDHPATRWLKTIVFGIPRNVAATPLGLPLLEELRVLAAPDVTCDLIVANPTVKRAVLDRVRLDGFASLAKILPQLVELKLRTWIAPGVMRDFVEAPLEHLEVLRVPGHECGSFIPALVARDLPKLRELDLRGVDLEGATQTADPMTDAHMIALARSPLRPAKLGVGVSAVTARGLRDVLDAPIAASIEELIVEAITLDADDVRAICALPRIGKLQLIRCGIADDTRATLEARFGGDVLFAVLDEWIEHE
jgi:hypothetical protein